MPQGIDAEEIFWSMEEVTHSGDFMICTSSLNIFRVIKSIRIRWEWHMETREDEKRIPNFNQKNCKDRNTLQALYYM